MSERIFFFVFAENVFDRSKPFAREKEQAKIVASQH